MSPEVGLGLLPVHGFVLAGGKSSRMGLDKATLLFRGRPMVAIAVEKLRAFCMDVSIVGNRDDLSEYATVVQESRLDVGPAAGVEAGLRAAARPWAMFVPVDVPLVPDELLRRWAETVCAMPGSEVVASNLFVGVNQPGFCMVRSDRAPMWSAALDTGERRLSNLLRSMGRGGGFHLVHDPGEFYQREERPSDEVLTRWFTNVNTPGEFAEAERSSDTIGPGAYRERERTL